MTFLGGRGTGGMLELRGTGTNLMKKKKNSIIYIYICQKDKYTLYMVYQKKKILLVSKYPEMRRNAIKSPLKISWPIFMTLCPSGHWPLLGPVSQNWVGLVLRVTGTAEGLQGDCRDDAFPRCCLVFCRRPWRVAVVSVVQTLQWMCVRKEGDHILASVFPFLFFSCPSLRFRFP